MPDSVERELLIPAGTEEVWRFVTGEGWLADEVELELRPGGEARFRSGEVQRSGWVESVAAPRGEEDTGRLSFWWAADGETASRVELTVELFGTNPAVSRLRVVETRPLDVLDLIGTPLRASGAPTYGPALLAA